MLTNEIVRKIVLFCKKKKIHGEMTYDGGNTSTIAYPLAIVFLNIHPKLSVHVINGC